MRCAARRLPALLERPPSNQCMPRNHQSPVRYLRLGKFSSTSSSRTARRAWTQRRLLSRDRAARRQTPRSHWQGSVLLVHFAALSAMTSSAPDFKRTSLPRASTPLDSGGPIRPPRPWHLPGKTPAETVTFGSCAVPTHG